jgi:hypothetical protein
MHLSPRTAPPFKPATRKRIFRCIITGLIIISLVFIAPTLWSELIPVETAAPVAGAIFQDFDIDGYRVDCAIQNDGSVLVTEAIDLKYRTDCEAITLKLPLERATSLTLQSVAISADTSTGGAVSLVEVLPAESSQQANSQTLTYTFNEDTDPRRLKISAFGAADTARKIVVAYQLQGVVVRAGDSILLRRTFFSSLGRLVVTEPILMLNYPEKIKLESVWFQAISKAQFLAAQVDANTVQMSTARLGAGQSMEAALVLPAAGLSATISELPETHDRAALVANINHDVQRVATDERLARIWANLTWILILIAGFLMILLVLLFDREGLTPFRRSQETPLRSDFRPAVLARLFRLHYPGQLLLGTLLDLVQRGKLRLDGHVFSLDDTKSADYREMSAYEIFLVQWLFDRVARSTTISTAQIRKYALDRRSAPEFAAYYDQLIKLINEEMVKDNLIDQAKNRLGKRIGIALGSTYIVFGILFSILLCSFTGLFLLLPALYFFLYGTKNRHLTGEGNRQAHIGRAFRKSLKHFAIHMEASTIGPDQVATNLSQAVALGLIQPYLTQVELAYSKQPGLICAFLRKFTRSMIAADPANQLQNFAHDLEAMGSMLSASLYFALGIHFYE